MFKILGALTVFYVLYATAVGKVYAKSGAGGRTIFREDSPEYFWIVIVIYLGLGIALMTMF